MAILRFRVRADSIFFNDKYKCRQNVWGSNIREIFSNKTNVIPDVLYATGGRVAPYTPIITFVFSIPRPSAACRSGLIRPSYSVQTNTSAEPIDARLLVACEAFVFYQRRRTKGPDPTVPAYITQRKRRTTSAVHAPFELLTSTTTRRICASVTGHRVGGL